MVDNTPVSDSTSNPLVAAQPGFSIRRRYEPDATVWHELVEALCQLLSDTPTDTESAALHPSPSPDSTCPLNTTE